MNGKWNRGQKKKRYKAPHPAPQDTLAQTRRQKSLAGGEDGENGSINNQQHKTLMSHFSRGVDPRRALCYTETLSFKVTASVVSLFFSLSDVQRQQQTHVSG